MTIEQKILAKLEPHAMRIGEGRGNDFDYLPAVLLQLMEEQKRQAKLLDGTASLLEIIKSTGDTIGVQGRTQITAFESAAQKKLEQIETAINSSQTQLQNTQSAMSEQIAVIASAQAAHAKQVNESLSAIALKIESFSSNTRRSHVNSVRLLISGLVASTAIIGLAVAILQRH